MPEPKIKSTVKERIVKISNELRISKEGKNEFQNFEYFKPDDIAKAINPLMEKHSLIVKFDMPFDSESRMYKGTLTIEDINSDENQIYTFAIPLTEVKGAGAGQNAGATMTYCKRYMIMNAFNIADNSADPDSKEAAVKTPVKSATPIRDARVSKPRQNIGDECEWGCGGKIQLSKAGKFYCSNRCWLPENIRLRANTTQQDVIEAEQPAPEDEYNNIPIVEDNQEIDVKDIPF